jgi:hypothetical protein
MSEGSFLSPHGLWVKVLPSHPQHTAHTHMHVTYVHVHTAHRCTHTCTHIYTFLLPFFASCKVEPPRMDWALNCLLAWSLGVQHCPLGVRVRGEGQDISSQRPGWLLLVVQLPHPPSVPSFLLLLPQTGSLATLGRWKAPSHPTLTVSAGPLRTPCWGLGPSPGW